MGRKAKYATYTKYEPYIKIMMRELGLEGKVALTWRFRYWKRKGGSAILHELRNSDGLRMGTVDISNRNPHMFILATILHELQHVKDMFEERLKLGFRIEEKTSRGSKWYPAAKWDGVLYRFHRLARKTERADYYNDPWEKEAYTMGTEENVLKLFPNGALPSAHQFIGQMKHSNIKLYRTKG